MSETQDLIDVKIALLNKPSSKELLQYIQNNLQRFVSEGHLKFSFVLVKTSSDLPKEFKNVKEFPAMATSKGVISGNISIKQYIENFMAKSKGGGGPPPVSSNISDLEKYQRSTLLQEEDIEEDAQSDLQERMQSVLKERKNNIDPGMQSKRVTQEEDTRDNFNEIFDAAYNSATKGKGNDDDSLMHRFFDNQEETPME